MAFISYFLNVFGVVLQGFKNCPPREDSVSDRPSLKLKLVTTHTKFPLAALHKA